MKGKMSHCLKRSLSSSVPGSRDKSDVIQLCAVMMSACKFCSVVV